MKQPKERTMTKTKTKWIMVGRVEPRGKGQRFFILDDIETDWKNPVHRAGWYREILAGGVNLYIADNSGDNPGNTDDGPRKVMQDEPIRIGQWSDRLNATVAVRVGEETGDGKYSRAGLTMKEAAWLVEHAGMRVVIDAKVRGVIEAHAKLWSARAAR
jgi:hypothetical protein